MIDEHELLTMFGRLEADALGRWGELGWDSPHQHHEGGRRFDASDVIRLRLIDELHHDLPIEDDSMSVAVSSVMEQLDAVRRSKCRCVSAVEAEPDDVRARFARLGTARR